MMTDNLLSIQRCAVAAFCALLVIAPLQVAAVGGDSSGGSAGASVDFNTELRKARQHITAERYSRAIQLLRDVVSQDRRNAEAFNLLGFASRKLEKYRDAERYYVSALKIDPEHRGALEYQGELFLAIGQPENAHANLARLLELCGINCTEYRELKRAIAVHLSLIHI